MFSCSCASDLEESGFQKDHCGADEHVSKPRQETTPLATLLIVDDSEAARAEIRSVLERTGAFDRIIEAMDGFRGLKVILSESIDVVVCDLEMPGFDGEKLLRAKQVNPGGSNTPFIFVTASEDLNRRTRLLEYGASDVITKPFHGPDLAARLQLHLKVKKLQDELMVKNDVLAKMSTSDSLTGLRTRRYVSEVLNIEFLRARRYESPLAVIMGDLDNFKVVNDTFGHLTGDAVLREVSALLLSQLRGTDVGSRYGGEEIFAVLHRCDALGAAKFAERWRGAIEHSEFKCSDGSQVVPVTISIGVAEFHPDMISPDDLIEAADRAMYRAKDAGRNRIELGTPPEF